MSHIHSTRAVGSHGLPSTEPAPQDTTEVRWFGSGAIPASVREWFSDPAHPASVELRRDAYWMQASHDIGLKSRDNGPLEIKLRRGSRGNFEVIEGVPGRIEEWRKVPVVMPLGIDSIGNWRWSEVHKRVATTTFVPDSSGGVVPIHHPHLAPAGCDVELAAVKVDDTAAWTFAFEAWGPADERLGLLERSWEALCRLGSPVPMELGRLEQTAGYPEWLATVAWAGEVFGDAPGPTGPLADTG